EADTEELPAQPRVVTCYLHRPEGRAVRPDQGTGDGVEAVCPDAERVQRPEQPPAVVEARIGEGSAEESDVLGGPEGTAGGVEDPEEVGVDVGVEEPVVRLLPCVGVHVEAAAGLDDVGGDL